MKRFSSVFLFFIVVSLNCMGQSPLNVSDDDSPKRKFIAIIKWNDETLKPEIDLILDIIKLSRLTRECYPGKDIIPLTTEVINFSQKVLSDAIHIENYTYDLFLFHAFNDTTNPYFKYPGETERKINDTVTSIKLWPINYRILLEKYAQLDTVMQQYNIFPVPK